MVKIIIKKILSYMPIKYQQSNLSKYHYLHSQYKIYRALLSVYVLRFNMKVSYNFKFNRSEKQNQGFQFIEKESIENRKKHEIILKDSIKLQTLINSLSYPYTHQYNLKGLKTKGILKIRLAQMRTISSNFFNGNNFLDIGCNKGFFSLLASQRFNQVQSIDVDKKFTDLCQLLKQPNMKVECTSFRDFAPEQEFDKILIGNVHHYLFRECGGWEWVYKLATMSRGLVLIEGPVDMNCQDMANAIPKNLQERFTFESFMTVMNRFFSLQCKIDSVLPGRYVMLFERKPDEFDQVIQFNELPVSKVLKDDKNSIVFLTKRNGREMIAKVIKNPGNDLRIRINIARLSPISNGAIGSIYHKKRFIGWLEEFRNDEIYHYKENQAELFRLICNHNIFLAKLGYFDSDCATINFFKKDSKLFDKSLVMPIKKIDESVFHKFPGYDKGYYFVHLQNSYDIIDKKIQNHIYEALKSKDSNIIQTTFAKIKKEL